LRTAAEVAHRMRSRRLNHRIVGGFPDVPAHKPDCLGCYRVSVIRGGEAFELNAVSLECGLQRAVYAGTARE
jgi:hypothetical protein